MKAPNEQINENNNSAGLDRTFWDVVSTAIVEYVKARWNSAADSSTALNLIAVNLVSGARVYNFLGDKFVFSSKTLAFLSPDALALVYWWPLLPLFVALLLPAGYFRTFLTLFASSQILLLPAVLVVKSIILNVGVPIDTRMLTATRIWTPEELHSRRLTQRRQLNIILDPGVFDALVKNSLNRETLSKKVRDLHWADKNPSWYQLACAWLTRANIPKKLAYTLLLTVFTGLSVRCIKLTVVWIATSRVGKVVAQGAAIITYVASWLPGGAPVASVVPDAVVVAVEVANASGLTIAAAHSAIESIQNQINPAIIKINEIGHAAAELEENRREVEAFALQTRQKLREQDDWLGRLYGYCQTAEPELNGLQRAIKASAALAAKLAARVEEQGALIAKLEALFHARSIDTGVDPRLAARRKEQARVEQLLAQKLQEQGSVSDEYEESEDDSGDDGKSGE